MKRKDVFMFDSAVIRVLFNYTLKANITFFFFFH